MNKRRRFKQKQRRQARRLAFLRGQWVRAGVRSVVCALCRGVMVRADQRVMVSHGICPRCEALELELMKW